MRSLIRRRGGDLFLHVERVWHDVRHGARVFVRNPALTTIAVLSIAGRHGADRVTAHRRCVLVRRAVVVAVTSLAAAIPARHAARINPRVALRCE